jgi:hypothetical protein
VWQLPSAVSAAMVSEEKSSEGCEADGNDLAW